MIDVRSAAAIDPKERPVFGLLQRHVLLAKAYPAHLAAGQGWFAGLGCPLAEYAASLRFQTSAPLPHKRGGPEFDKIPRAPSAQNSGTTHHHHRTKAMVEPVGIEPTT
ncbi:hypothetical protein [Microvirga sp. TS319]|uniref:hypothetical protein n=1 Tax=Microvirga sp. TS319 TaxID=3241165 RepID=UPI00351A1801